ncbi:hypothetical protein V6N13_117120 [Hibiscus sabdariffa]
MGQSQTRDVSVFAVPLGIVDAMVDEEQSHWEECGLRERTVLATDGIPNGVDGIVIRDEMGAWIVGFSKFIGICSTLEVELWGVLEGLHLAWRLGECRVVVELDSLVTVDLLHGRPVRCAPSSIVYHIFQLWKGSKTRHGEVKRTFIAKKLSRGGKRFGFVEFESQVNANRAMERLNGFSTYGFKLTVKVAREENMKKAGERKHPINEQVRDHRRGEKKEISQRADSQTQKDFITRQTCCKKVLGTWKKKSSGNFRNAL